MAILLSRHPTIEPPVSLLEQLPLAERKRIYNYLLITKLRISRDPLVPPHLKDHAFHSVAQIVEQLALERAFARAGLGDPVINYSFFYRRNVITLSTQFMMDPIEILRNSR